jgi:hypothetical protein
MTRTAGAVVLALVTAVCFWPVLRGETLYDVRTLQHYREGRPGPAPNDRGDTILSLPMLHRLYGEGLRAGELRLWNPLLFCGYPAYHNLLLHPFYPPNLLLFSLLPHQPAYDLGLLVHFLGSGLAMSALLAGLGRSPLAATAGALVWMLQGYFAFWFSPGTLQGLSVFLPLTLLFLHRALDGSGLRAALLAGGCLGLGLLGSHGQHALLSLLFCGAWILLRGNLRVGAAFLAAVFGVGMAAVLTQFDAVLNGLRIAGGDFPLHYASPFKLPLHLLGIFVRGWAPKDPLLASEFTVHLGFAAGGLAVAGAVVGRREPWIRFLAVVSAVALLVAFVQPLAQAAATVPLLNLSMPARWVFLFCLSAPLLAARGLDALPDPRLGALLACIVLLELLPGFKDMNRHEAASWPAPGPVREGRAIGSDGAPTGAPFAQDGWRLSIGHNLLALRGIPAVAGYESIAPLSAVDLAVRISGPGAVMGSGRALAVFDLHSPWLDLAGARWLHMPFDHEPGGRWRPVDGEAYRLYENPDALPRAFLVDPGVAGRIPGDRFDAREGLQPARIRWIEDAGDRLVLDVETERPGRLVIADTHYPGWRATLDGASVPIHPAYGVFRSVDVPAGHHRLELRFAPRTAGWGLAISALSALLLFAIQIPRPSRRGILRSG